MVDVERLKRSWAHVAAYGDQVALRFYSRLFVAAPETRNMFPLSMSGQRDRFVIALGHTVAHIDSFERIVPYLQQLGRDHRRFGVVTEHYAPVAEALMATLADFLGNQWTPDLAQDWEDAYRLVATVMVDAAEQAAHTTPPWWDAEVVAHQQRTFDIAVLTVQPEEPYRYAPGQSMAVEVEIRPRLWRYYSPANAPRQHGSLDLHVRRIPGGRVSTALVDSVQKGDVVRLGPPVGNRLVLPPDGHRDLLLIAGGTGLAPLKALTEQVAARTAAGEAPRQISFYLGARTARELYDLDDLRAMEAQNPWLTVVAALSDDPAHPGAPPAGATAVAHGDIAAVALEISRRHDHDVYVCGSDQMVVATLQLLREAGYPAEQVFYEGFQGLGGELYGVIDPGGRYQQ